MTRLEQLQADARKFITAVDGVRHLAMKEQTVLNRVDLAGLVGTLENDLLRSYAKQEVSNG